MLNFRATAFLTRSVRQDSRLLSHHGMRAGLALLILFLFFTQTRLTSLRGAVGAGFAQQVVNCCYWFLTILGGIHFSSTISEEKDEQTLALLKMTGASGFSILAGKSLPRLAVAVLFLFVVAPFFLLSITLGGVLTLGIVTSMLSMMTYAFMLGQLGLFASVLASSTRRAFSLTCVLWLLFELPHWWVGLLMATLDYLFGRGYSLGLTDFWEASQSVSLVSNLSATLLAFRPEEVWQTYMTYELIVGAAFFVISWLIFEPCTSRAVSEGPTVASTRGRIASLSDNARPQRDAVAWKSWRFLSGGWTWFFVRTVGAPVTVFLVSFLLTQIFGVSFDGWIVVIAALYIGLAFWLITTARMLGRCFSEEIHGDTLASLVMLPRRTGLTFWSLVKGVVPAILASSVTFFLCLGLLFLWMLSEGDLGDFLEAFVQPWLWHFLSWVAVTAHLGVLLTTHLRFGGMLLAVAICWFGMPILCGMSFALVLSSGPNSVELYQYVIPIMLIIFEVFICAVLQRQIFDRLVMLAGK